MARIGKSDHPRILEMIDVEECKVAEVAAAYGCTPANIYALLGKLRRAGRIAAKAALADDPAPTLFEAPGEPEAAAPEAPRVAAPTPVAHPPVARPPVAVVRPVPQPPKMVAAAPPASPAPSATVTDLPRREARGIGASRAKPGFGLAMRTAEGDEALTPFRSLEDLLSAIKPILRAAARSPEPVWFAVQTIDLATLDSDAA